MVGELVHGDVQAPAAYHPALVHWILGLVSQGYELVVVLERGKVESRGPSDQLPCDFLDRLQLFGESGHLRSARSPVESAHSHVDRMNRPSTQYLDDGVPGLLELQGVAHFIGILGATLGHGEGALVTQEVRRVEKEHVQYVALDPFSAVQEPAQGPERFRQGDSQHRFQGVASTHLVSHRANPANPRGDVRHLGDRPAS